MAWLTLLAAAWLGVSFPGAALRENRTAADKKMLLTQPAAGGASCKAGCFFSLPPNPLEFQDIIVIIKLFLIWAKGGIIGAKRLLYLRIPVSARAAEIRALELPCSEI